MTSVAALPIYASADPAESRALTTSAGLLNAALTLAEADAGCRAAMILLPPMAAPPVSGKVAIVSLCHELRRPPAASDVLFERWRGYLAGLQGSQSAVFLCTVFRHVPDREKHSATLARIRQLNLLALELSCSLGVGVIDIDRALAHFGARFLRTDFRLGGARAAVAAGHAIADALLAWGLDAFVDPSIQERARQRLGGLDQVRPLLDRLEHREARAAAGVRE